MDAQQPWKKKGGTASWMAAAGALESGDLELEPRLQLLHGHARVIIACPHWIIVCLIQMHPTWDKYTDSQIDIAVCRLDIDSVRSIAQPLQPMNVIIN